MAGNNLYDNTILFQKTDIGPAHFFPLIPSDSDLRHGFIMLLAQPEGHGWSPSPGHFGHGPPSTQQLALMAPAVQAGMVGGPVQCEANLGPVQPHHLTPHVVHDVPQVRQEWGNLQRAQGLAEVHIQQNLRELAGLTSIRSGQEEPQLQERIDHQLSSLQQADDPAMGQFHRLPPEAAQLGHPPPNHAWISAADSERYHQEIAPLSCASLPQPSPPEAMHLGHPPPNNFWTSDTDLRLLVKDDERHHQEIVPPSCGPVPQPGSQEPPHSATARTQPPLTATVRPLPGRYTGNTQSVEAPDESKEAPTDDFILTTVQQVKATLSTDPAMEDLLKLKKDLQEMIKLTSHVAEEDSSTHSSDANTHTVIESIEDNCMTVGTQDAQTNMTLKQKQRKVLAQKQVRQLKMAEQEHSNGKHTIHSKNEKRKVKLNQINPKEKLQKDAKIITDGPRTGIPQQSQTVSTVNIVTARKNNAKDSSCTKSTKGSVTKSSSRHNTEHCSRSRSRSCSLSRSNSRSCSRSRSRSQSRSWDRRGRTDQYRSRSSSSRERRRGGSKERSDGDRRGRSRSRDRSHKSWSRSRSRDRGARTDPHRGHRSSSRERRRGGSKERSDRDRRSHSRSRERLRPHRNTCSRSRSRERSRDGTRNRGRDGDSSSNKRGGHDPERRDDRYRSQSSGKECSFSRSRSPKRRTAISKDLSGVKASNITTGRSPTPEIDEEKELARKQRELEELKAKIAQAKAILAMELGTPAPGFDPTTQTVWNPEPLLTNMEEAVERLPGQTPLSLQHYSAMLVHREAHRDELYDPFKVDEEHEYQQKELYDPFQADKEDEDRPEREAKERHRDDLWHQERTLRDGSNILCRDGLESGLCMEEQSHRQIEVNEKEESCLSSHHYKTTPLLREALFQVDEEDVDQPKELHDHFQVNEEDEDQSQELHGPFQVDEEDEDQPKGETIEGHRDDLQCYKESLRDESDNLCIHRELWPHAATTQILRQIEVDEKESCLGEEEEEEADDSFECWMEQYKRTTPLLKEAPSQEDDKQEDQPKVLRDCFQVEGKYEDQPEELHDHLQLDQKHEGQPEGEITEGHGDDLQHQEESLREGRDHSCSDAMEPGLSMEQQPFRQTEVDEESCLYEDDIDDCDEYWMEQCKRWIRIMRTSQKRNPQDAGMT